MHVNKSSTFYKFLTTNWYCKDEVAYRGVPDNLCPFMRKVLGVSLLNFFLGLCITFIAACMFHAPLMWMGGPLTELQSVMASLGTVAWGFVGIFAFAFAIGRIGIVQATSRAVSGSGSFQTAVGWSHAVHDKVCPRITFK